MEDDNDIPTSKPVYKSSTTSDSTPVTNDDVHKTDDNDVIMSTSDKPASSGTNDSNNLAG